MHKIILKDIKVFAYHGLYEQEIKNGQNFYITLKYVQSHDKSKANDKIGNVIDYSDVIVDIKDRFTSKRYNLIETVAHDIFSFLKEKYQFIYLFLSIQKKDVLLDVRIKNIIIEIESE